MKLERSDKKNTEIVFEEGYRVKVLQDSLLFSLKNINYNIGIVKIKKIIIRNGVSFGQGLLWGFGIGFVLGFGVGGTFSFHGSQEFHFNHALEGGVIIGLPFALIGGGIGALIKNFDDYEFTNENSQTKREMIRDIFRKNKIK